jgi:squalene-hopene/tetraprenyl-beta-curcumene cyclase
MNKGYQPEKGAFARLEDTQISSLRETVLTGGADLGLEHRARSEADLPLLDRVIAEAAAALKARQAEDGHWCFELEADATIPAEYILLEHFLDDINPDVQTQLAVYLRAKQALHGGWPLYHDGDFNISASVKAYYALKLVGDDPDAPHMMRARDAILAHGGAARGNVFTRITLALFGQVPWRAVPVMPIEIMLLPRWSPFHLSRVSYWSRTVLVPLLVLMARRPCARNPRRIGIRELFVTPPEEEKHYLRNPTGAFPGELFLLLDRLLRLVEPLFPSKPRERAIQAAIEFVTKRLNGDDGLGGIFPAMANSVMAFDTLGFAPDQPARKTAMSAIRGLLMSKKRETFCQPCVSPLWDTVLAMYAMMEAGEPGTGRVISEASEWVIDCQVLDTVGDWADKRPNLRPGGWTFQYRNAYYPDLDDTGAAVMALDRAGGPAASPELREAVKRGTEWVLGMQCRKGGWGSFDADNTHFYLNHIPFADHGALLDPPTADVTARCVSMLGQLGHGLENSAVAKGMALLKREQEPDGSWFGRWGVNYIYGTWCVLSACHAVGEDPNSPYIRKAVDWLKAGQRADGGWGEDGETYWPERRGEAKASTPTQTAWALLALMSAGECDSEAVRRGVDFLLSAPRTAGSCDEAYYNAVGFPRVFYLHYHGYPAYFPLWALARYRNLTQAGSSNRRDGRDRLGM